MTEGVAGREMLGSITAPHIGAVFEGSRAVRKVQDLYGRVEVPLCKVENDDDRQLWAFRNIHAFREYTSPITIHWYQAAQDWLLDVRTASSHGKKEGDRLIPLDTTEKRGVREIENLVKAMVAVTASARAMDTSAGSMDAYVSALVGDNLDRADTWSEFLVHKDRGKIDLLKRNPAIHHYYGKILADVYMTNSSGERTPRIDSQMVDFLKKGRDYKGGMREYVEQFLLQETDQELDQIFDQYPLFADDEVRMTAANLAADIFLIDEYTQWEYDTEHFYYQAHQNDQGVKEEDKKIQLMPTQNWGGNPLRAILEPSFLPKTIKRMYAGDQQIWELVDDAFTFKIAREANDEFNKNYQLKPTMTTPLKALARYGQALMSFYGGSTAPDLAAWGKEQLDGKAGIPAILTLMNQVVGDAEGTGDTQWPFGKDAMGWFTSRILYIKSLAAVRQFVQPSSFELVFSQEDKRNLKEIARFIFGSTIDFKSGLLYETASAGLGFKYKQNRIERVVDTIYEIKNLLMLGGEAKEGEAQFKKSLMMALNIAVILGGGGGGRRK